MTKDELLEHRLTESIIGAFYEVYNRLGYGFSEKVYARALVIELRHRGHDVRQEVQVVVYYRDKFLCRDRIDLLVVDRVVVEVKSAESMPPVAAKQCRSYLKVLDLQVGLALNFGPKPEIKRVIYRGAPMSHVEIRFPVSGGPDPNSGLAHLPEGLKI